MARKYLHELLKEDQEPFLLNKYISDKRSQIIKTQISPRKKHKPSSSSLHHHHHHQNSNFPTNLCKNVCLFSFSDTTTTTPDLRKSPLFDFSSPAASKTKSPIKFHIPSRTASLLLEAALKIQKHSSSKTKTQNKSNGFGLLGSFFKKLTQRNQNKKREIEGSNVNLSVKDILMLESRKLSNGCLKMEERLDFSFNNNNNNMGSSNENVSEVGFVCSSFNGGRTSSAVWSESNEDKSLDMEMETSSSSCCNHSDDEDSELKEIDEFVTNEKQSVVDCVFCHEMSGFCDSPFRFALQSSSSSGRRTPEIPSPVPSPGRRMTKDKEINGGEGLKKLQAGEEEEEDKEQCSPVCVLDPPFEDDDEGHGNDDVEEGDSSDLRCSYAIIQRAKQQLLYKLRRFEKLAELDPVELEKRMLEDEDVEEDETFMEEDDCEDEDSEVSYKGNDFIELVYEALCHSSFNDIGQIPEGLKKLVADLIVEEDRELDSLEDREMVIRRVCKRLESWKEVESNTIDMMIEEDFSREDGGWKKNMEQTRDMAGELEFAIFGLLVEEFSEELVC
ncbi:hypothetical protein RIF29_39783 [Crotalaria pallida]|uniref:DUF4378 domain-containing protein n=1 Tax=Crotalaria pallida TaxID=3830 RepID=A0AAN9E1T9_CROPI